MFSLVLFPFPSSHMEYKSVPKSASLFDRSFFFHRQKCLFFQLIFRIVKNFFPFSLLACFALFTLLVVIFAVVFLLTWQYHPPHFMYVEERMQIQYFSQKSDYKCSPNQEILYFFKQDAKFNKLLISYLDY